MTQSRHRNAFSAPKRAMTLQRKGRSTMLAVLDAIRRASTRQRRINVSGDAPADLSADTASFS